MTFCEIGAVYKRGRRYFFLPAGFFLADFVGLADFLFAFFFLALLPPPKILS